MSWQFQNQLFKNPILCSYCLLYNSYNFSFIVSSSIHLMRQRIIMKTYSKWIWSQSTWTYLFIHSVIQSTNSYCRQGNELHATRARSISSASLEYDKNTNVSRYDQVSRRGGYQNCPWLMTTELEKIELVIMSSRRDRVPAHPLWSSSLSPALAIQSALFTLSFLTYSWSQLPSSNDYMYQECFAGLSSENTDTSLEVDVIMNSDLQIRNLKFRNCGQDHRRVQICVWTHCLQCLYLHWQLMTPHVVPHLS